jgi:glucose-6-phosphate isomerase
MVLRIIFSHFFYSDEKNSPKINNERVLLEQKFLKNKDINQIMYAQKKATEIVFKRKKFPLEVLK